MMLRMVETSYDHCTIPKTCFYLAALNEDIRRPKLEQIAIVVLNDPSPEVARNAAEALEKYGSGTAEAALWARLEKFHEQWKDRADELRIGLVRSLRFWPRWG
jgi:hypothetical protein